MVTKFKNHLAKTNLAKNTVTSYVWTVQYFLNHYGDVNKKNLLAYSKHSKKCTFYTLRFGCSFAAVNTIKPQLL